MLWIFQFRSSHMCLYLNTTGCTIKLHSNLSILVILLMLRVTFPAGSHKAISVGDVMIEGSLRKPKILFILCRTQSFTVHFSHMSPVYLGEKALIYFASGQGIDACLSLPILTDQEGNSFYLLSFSSSSRHSNNEGAVKSNLCFLFVFCFVWPRKDTTKNNNKKTHCIQLVHSTHMSVSELY